MFKSYVQKKLENYVKQYFAAHPEIKLVGIAGSVGKTSTKRAIATVLAAQYRVRMDDGNLNSEFGAPCAMLGITYPESIRNPLAWWKVFRAAKARVKNPADVDIIIQEFGTDHPGDIAKFGRYVTPDIALVTAVTPEHMEFFGTIEAVAEEEMAIAKFSRFVLINRDDVEGRFAELQTNPEFSTYGTSGTAEYRVEPGEFSREHGFSAVAIAPEYTEPINMMVKVVGEHSMRAVAAAVAVGARYGMTAETIVAAVATIRPVPGRMNLLKGIGGTWVIDDTYNSSPAAAEAALRTLYSFDDAAERIAVLGDMRELGESSPREHEKIGALCDGNLLSWVVTVGPESEKHLAPAARARGCQVKVCRNAIEAGQFVRAVTEEGSVILVKGSQNTIYLEEAVKILVEMSEDRELVRQSASWQKTKDEFFAQFY